MNVKFFNGPDLLSEVVMTWRPEKGDEIVIGGKLYEVPPPHSFRYDVDNATWCIYLVEL